MPDPLAFPTFPSPYTEKDVNRLADIEKQKIQMQDLYQQKMNPVSWQKTNIVEKTARTAVEEWMPGFVSETILPAITPDSWGFDFGLTPEEFDRHKQELEVEYKELKRKEAVSQVLPRVMATIELFALKGEPIPSREEFRSKFKLEEVGFTEEEIGWAADYAQKVSTMTPEEILSGSKTGEISEEDIRKWMTESTTKKISPSLILSTVAFSRDMDQISSALKAAYPPEETEEAITEEDALLKQRTEQWKELLRQAGIVPKAGETTSQTTQRAMEAIAGKGSPVVLTESETGNVLSAMRRPDGSIWDETNTNLLGYYDNETGRLIPIDIEGTPLPTEEVQHRSFMDLWNNFYLNIREGLFQSGQALTYTMPKGTIQNINELGGVPAPEKEAWLKQREDYYTAHPEKVQEWEEYKAGIKKQQEDLNALWKDRYDKSNAEFEDWVKANPELTAMRSNKKYQEGLTTHPELVLDPMYIGYLISSSAPLIAAGLATGLLTTAATRNPIAGAVAGASVIAPAQTEQVKQDMIQSGASDQVANEASTVMGALISAVEVMPGITELRAIAPALFTMFKRTLLKETVTGVSTKLALKGAIKTGTTIMVQEAVEESIQQAMQNAVVKTIDPNRSVLANIPETFAETLIATIPLAILGGGGKYTSMKQYLPQETQTQIDVKATELKAAGLSPIQAEEKAFLDAVENPVVQAQVVEASYKAEEVIPEEKPVLGKKIKELQSSLANINRLISNYSNQIAKRKEEIAKYESLEGDINAQERVANDEEAVANLESLMIELEIRKERVTKNLAKHTKTQQTVTEEVPAVTNREIPISRATEALTTEARTKVEEIKGTVKAGTDTSLPSLWNSMTQEDRVLMAQGAGIAKSSAKLTWEELNDIQRDRLSGIGENEVEVIPEAIRSLPSTHVLSIISNPSVAPRFTDIDEELEAIEKTLEGHPEISRRITQDSVRAKSYRDAKRLLDDFQRRVMENYTSEGEMKILNQEASELTQRARVAKSRILATKWEDLPPEDRRALAAVTLPDKAISWYADWELLDSRFVLRYMEKLTGQPFGHINRRMVRARSYVDIVRHEYSERLNRISGFKKVANDKESRIRVAQYVNSFDPTLHVQVPPNITAEERQVGDAVMRTYDEWKPIVRMLRFLEAYEDSHNVKSIMDEIPDATQAEIQNAINVYEQQGEDALWTFLFSQTWGVRESGYDPQIVTQPNLFSKVKGMSTARGRGRLMSRNVNQFIAEDADQIFSRQDSYILSMGVRWFLRNDIRELAKVHDLVYDKWKDGGKVNSYLMKYLEELQGFRQEGSFLSWAIGRIYNLSAPVIFARPWLAMRNVVQPLWSFPYRLALLKSLVTYGRLPEDVQAMFNTYFNGCVDQSKKAFEQFLYSGESVAHMGELNPVEKIAAVPVKALDLMISPLSRAANRISFFPWSDYISRLWSFDAAAEKAWKASEQYKKDHDIEKWIRDSGLSKLPNEAQDDILEVLARDSVDLGVPGTERLSGTDAASILIAEDMTSNYLYLYNRYSRSKAEWGQYGRTVGSLLVFPKSTAQMYFLELSKLGNKNLGMKEKISVCRNVAGVIVAGIFLDTILQALSGRDKEEYSIWNMFNWSLGGMQLGMAQDVFEMTQAIIKGLTGDEEEKSVAWSTLTNSIPVLLDNFVGFYNLAENTLESFLGESKGADKRFLRKIRAYLDSKYTPQEQEKIERNWYEWIQHAIADSPDPELALYEQAISIMQEAEAKLGQRDEKGSSYTLKQYAGTAQSALSSLPDDMITEQYGFSPLTTFYYECQKDWEEYYKLASDPPEIRENWRKSHIKVEAELLFWGKYDSLIKGLKSDKKKEVNDLLNMWVKQYGITKYEHSHFADWTLPELSEEEEESY